MQLSKRMCMLASMVTGGNRLADIGTDHAYIPIFLKESGKIPSAVAMDVRKGPLLRAQAHIEEAGLSEYIETRLSDGLEKLAPGEADTILIAGMGGPLTNRILAARPLVAASAKELVLQPQSEIAGTRLFLAAQGYCILQEEIVCEEGKFYPMMRVKKGTPWNMTPLEAAFGPLLLEKKSPVLLAYLEREEAQCQALLEKLSQADTQRVRERRKQVTDQLTLIEKAKEVFACGAGKS